MNATPLLPPADAAPTLQVHLLGRFAACVGGEELVAERWPSLRSTHLVQLLSLQPRRRMAREQVIDALWPQLDPEAGAANLRKATHHARQALGRQDAVVVQGGEMALWPERPVVVDADVFAREAEAALARRDAAACAEAARHYTGDLLPGTRYEPWTEAARERLHAAHLELLRASAQWDKLALIEPTDEPAHRALMQRELECGNRAAALRWYAHLRDALQQSLGISPDRQTEAVYERCLAGLQPQGPAFVGRALPLAQVLAALGMAPDERPGGLVLRGPSGIGKSALCREIGVQARARGWVVWRVEAARGGRAYAVLVALVERLLLADRALLDRIGLSARKVLALLSPLAAPADALPGPLGRHQVVGAIHRLLLASAGSADVLLQIDDAHLADDADVDVLMQLANGGAPLCVLMATRPPAPGSALARGIARLERAGVLQARDVEPLDDDECRRLVLRAAATPLDEAVLARLLGAAQGNAFAAIELARCAATARDRRLPDSTTEAILERLCDVPAEALALLKWLALCGDRFDVATIELLAGLAAAPAMSALDACLMEGVLVPTGSHYAFRHDLVRQALVDPIPQHRRLKMHREIADLLAQQDSAPADIAHHGLQAGRPRDAVRLAAFSDALRHLEALRLRAESLDALGDPAALAAYRVASGAVDGSAAHDLLAKAALAQVKQGGPKGALVLLEGLRPASVEGLLCEALAYSGARAR